MLRLTVVLGCALALGFPRGLPAQRREPSPGFWFAIGLGTGWARVTCAICRGDRPAGFSFYARLGGGVSRGLRVGGEAAAWRYSANGVVQHLTALSAGAYWYPVRRTRLYLKGGLGWVSHRAEDGTDVITSSGFGPQMGIGYELPVGRALYLAPYFNAVFGVIGGAVKFNAAQVTGAPRITLIQFGAALSGR
jgi:hypothetical protein